MSTLYHPHGYCVLCGAPKQHILDLRCESCTQRAQQAYYSTETTAGTEPRIVYDGQCEHCGGSVFRGPHGSLHSCPISVPLCDRDTAIELPAMRPCNVEEVTSDRASRISLMIYESIWEHQRSCEDCKRYRSMGLICVEQIMLWNGLKHWEKQIIEDVTE